ncbi:MAG: CpsD/CapB family tyrosine-protein kinase [Clostridia bacterium]|nr:CpsD/CapB family tyrosine-protein kinase [Clostridia bacterium]
MKFLKEIRRRRDEKRAYKDSKRIQQLSQRTEYLVDENSPPSVREAFRSIKVALSVAVPKTEGGKAIFVASAYPYAGKTMVAVNLASMFALSNLKVVIVDVDMRRGQIAKFFRATHKKGLSEYLSGQISYEDTVRVSPINENLSYIACGTHPPRPYELLESDQMKELIERLRKEYDYVIIDTPPILILSDALAVAPYTDGAVIVARHETTYLRDIERELELLRFAKVNVLGAIVNGYKDARRQREHDGYSYYYDSARKSK